MRINKIIIIIIYYFINIFLITRFLIIKKYNYNNKIFNT